MRLLRTIEHQREELARYVPSPVAELVSSPDGEELLEGHRREVTVVYCDIRNFTAFAETADPEELFAVLRRYQTEVGQVILRHQGTIGHYAGDGIMSFLNDPRPLPDHPIRGVRMAIEMRNRFAKLEAGWAKSGYRLGLGIGIALGYGTAGRVGFEGYYGYAAVGSVANLAARLCAVAEPGQIVISERAHARVEKRVRSTPLGEFEFKGFSHPMHAFAVEGLRSR